MEPDSGKPSDRVEALLPEVLARGLGAEEHYELGELERLAAGRRELGGDWEMPPHLSRCAVCLEMFELIFAGVPAAGAEVIDRFVGLKEEEEEEEEEGEKITARRESRPPTTLWLKLAAGIVVVAGAGFLFAHFSNRTTTAHVSAGALRLADGGVLASGAEVPGKKTLTVTEATRTTFADGTEVSLQTETEVKFYESQRSGTTLSMHAGTLDASVAKQSAGKKFVVKTPLGVVTVVGTKFRVSCEDEGVTVYESRADEAETRSHQAVVRAVRVSVFEGVVRVTRRGEGVEVTAQQTAVMRQNEVGIEVVREVEK